jgi:hypothetical protein
MGQAKQGEAFECGEGMELAKLFEVEGFGMVRVQPVPGDMYQLWLPFEPIPVQMRFM